MQKALIGASITGGFCVVFAMTIAWIAPQLSDTQLLAMSFVSGFCGSLVARLVLKRSTLAALMEGKKDA